MSHPLGEDGGGFGARVLDAVAARGPLCAGVDPSGRLLGDWGLSDDAAGVREFGLRCVEAFAGVVPVIKAQVAWFERHGSAGVAALEAVLAAARDAGLLVIADAKRGDVDVTNGAYADAWLGPASPLAADAVTVHPYLGLAALHPMIGAARANRRGLLVVVRSSNPAGRPLQSALTAAGTSVEDSLLAGIAACNAEEGWAPAGAGGRPATLGSVGAVIGATLEPSSFPLGDLGGVILAPGMGAQGATAADVARRFRGCPVVLASASRSVLAAGPDVASLSAAAARARDDVAGAPR